MAGRIKIRGAHPSEKDEIVSMLRELHREVRVYGGKVLPGPKTEDWLSYLFDEATTGRGLCLVAAHHGGLVGTSIAIEHELPYDSDFENPVFGFGTYVVPDYRKHGLAESLYRAMQREFHSRGNTYIGAYLVLNSPIKSVLKKLNVMEVETMIIFPRE